jgi:hypothetical protein
MKKFNAKRQKGAVKAAQSRWQGLAKILSLCARAQHTANVSSVVDSFHAVDLLAHQKNI